MIPFTLERKIKITIRSVDSIPCSLVGNSLEMDEKGNIQKDPWNFPWPMEWVGLGMEKLAREKMSVSQVFSERITNEEEPDQYIEVEGRSYIPLTTGDYFDRICSHFPDEEALISSDGKIRLSYRSLETQVENFAKGLISAGVKKGDRIAILAVNCPELVIAQMAIPKIGAIMVPMSVHDPSEVIKRKLKRAEANFLILQGEVRGKTQVQKIGEICPSLINGEPDRFFCQELPRLKNVIIFQGECSGAYSWGKIVERGSTVEKETLSMIRKELDIDDVAYMLFTSGTSGEGKGVMLSHGNVLENALAIQQKMDLTEKDVLAVLAPLFHCFGIITNTLAAITAGCGMVMIDRFKSKITLDVIEREKCTVLSGVPTLFIGLIEECQKKDKKLNFIRTGVIAGAPCPEDVFRCIYTVLGIEEIISSYGLTEASPCVTAAEREDSLEVKARTEGAIIPGVKVKITDPNSGEELPIGQQGEICVKGYNITKGYYGMPEETAKVIDEEGWLRSGDLGVVDRENRIHLMGRLKDLIIKCGENIVPVEIENHLLRNRKVSEAYVFGIPDYISGEEVVAFIKVLKGEKVSEEELREHCRSQLANIKIPKHFIQMEIFPMTPTGKVDKKQLKELALDLLKKDINYSCT